MFRYGATTLQANTWYFVTGVYDAATSALHVYLNGQLDDGTLLGTVTATQQNSSANVNIGRRPGSNSFNFNGRIDDVPHLRPGTHTDRDPGGYEHADYNLATLMAATSLVRSRDPSRATASGVFCSLL